ncbi:MAG TPA: 16S rRNA (cytosine(967)-C(5))-methyltransferase RsmB [Vicinamibacterales bacterium]|nr:16S rRNA (cytosine(967)-C(5))-methyltransferase RsmB [Vicinamibacterales bacterium]
MIAPARRAAYDVLRAVSAGTRDLPSALAASRDALRDPRDRALAGEIAIGSLRWRGALDAMIAKLARRPINRLDAEVVDILRLALYQLWHLARVPPSAVVNDAVELTRAARRGSAAALVNAALRAFGRTTPEALLPAPDRSAEYLSVVGSHPRWLVERWIARVGFEAAERWTRFNNSAAPLTLRVNTLRTTTERLRSDLRAYGVESEPAAHAPDALVVREGNPLSAPQFAAGECLVQDEGSQLVAHMAGARPGERILDSCASPGGKTALMSFEAGGPSGIVAADVRARRVALLRETLRRARVDAPIVQLDLRNRPPFLPVFDCVLVDAPCSGLGTVRRDPDIKWRRTEADLAPLAAAQRELLGHAAAAVRRAGRLVYATCSSEPEENEQVVDAFLQANGAFAPAGRGLLEALPRWGALAPLCDDGGRLRTLPHAHGLESFFAAVLVKANAV